MKLLIIVTLLFLGIESQALTKAETIFLSNIDKKIAAKAYTRALGIIEKRLAYENKRKNKSVEFQFELLAKAIVLGMKGKQSDKKYFDQFLNLYSISDDSQKQFGLSAMKAITNSLSSQEGKAFYKSIVDSKSVDFTLKNQAYRMVVGSFDIKSAERLSKYGEWFRFLREEKSEGSFEESAARLGLAADFETLGNPDRAIEQKEAAIRMVEQQINSSAPLGTGAFNSILKALIAEKQTTLANKLFNYFKDSKGGDSAIESVELKIATRASNFFLLFKAKKYSEAEDQIPDLLEVLPKSESVAEIVEVFENSLEIFAQLEDIKHLPLFIDAFSEILNNQNVANKVKASGKSGALISGLFDRLLVIRQIQFMTKLSQFVIVAQEKGLLEKATEKHLQSIASGLTQSGLVEEARIFYQLCQKKAESNKNEDELLRCRRQEGGLLVMNLMTKEFAAIQAKFELPKGTSDSEKDSEKLKLPTVLIRNHILNQRPDSAKKELDKLKGKHPTQFETPFFKLFDVVTTAQIFMSAEKYQVALKGLEESQGLLENNFGKNSSVLYLLEQMKLEASLSEGNIDASNRFFTEGRRKLSLNKPFIGFQRVSLLLKGMALAYAIRSVSLAKELYDEFETYCGQGTNADKFKMVMDMWNELIQLDQKGLKTSDKFKELYSGFKSEFKTAPYILSEHNRYINVLVKGTK